MDKLFNNDALDVLEVMIEKGFKVDAVITDPPFNIVEKSGGEIHLFRQSKQHKTNVITKDTMKFDDGFNQKLWLTKMQKIIKSGGNLIIFNDWENMGIIAKTLKENGFKVKQLGHWQKTNPLPSEWRRRIVPGREYFIHAIRKGKTHTFNTNEVWNGIIKGGLTKITEKKFGKHPNQKPIYLMEKLLEVFTNKNEIVLDPFMGSGSTGVAAKNLGRTFVGIELDKKYFDIAKKRINNE